MEPAQRVIYSLSYVLGLFEIKFEKAQEGKKYLAEVSAYRRNPCSGRSCENDWHGDWARDAKVCYGILEFDPQILEAFNKTSINGVLNDMVHDVSCGCVGCYCSTRSSWLKLQKLKNPFLAD